jgi:atypical dual specificity phosphatase
MHAEELDLAFVADDDVRRVLEDYYVQTRKAAEADSYLGVLVGCGSVVEGLLTWALLEREKEAIASPKAPKKDPKDPNSDVKPLREWSLAKLIEVSVQLGLLGKTASQASWGAQGLPQLHPSVQRATAERPSDPAACCERVGGGRRDPAQLAPPPQAMNDIVAFSERMNFSWVEEGAIAGCRSPRTSHELAFLVSVGVQALVRLASVEETGLMRADVAARGLAECYEPVEDCTPPSQEQLDRVVGFANDAIRSGKPVAVACGYGYGRTGTALACYLVSKGLDSEAAIRRLLEVRPCSSEITRVPGQRQAIVEFGRRWEGRNAGGIG